MFLVVLYVRETTQKDSSKVVQTIHSGSILLTYHTRVHGLMHLLHKQFALNPNPNPCIKPDNPGFFKSNPGFGSVTNISPVSSETNTNVINIGHIDGSHHVSTVPFNEEALVNNVIHNNQPARLTTDQCTSTNNDERMGNMSTTEQRGNADMKEDMRRRRRNNLLRSSKTELCKQNIRKYSKSKRISEAGI